MLVNPIIAVRREKAQSFNRCNSHPASVAPAGSNLGGVEAAGQSKLFLQTIPYKRGRLALAYCPPQGACNAF